MTDEESVVKLWGNAGNGIPLPFLVGEHHSPSLHDDSYLQHKQQKKCALNAGFKVTPIVNRGNFKSCIL